MDDADRAQIRIDADRQGAVDAIVNRKPGGQTKSGGDILCTQCWTPIPADRLDAVPDANWCLACQGEREGYY